jgi:hypothetical protein
MKVNKKLKLGELYMKSRKGISLIVLVITIIIIIILAGVVILNLVDNNIIEQSNEAKYKANIESYNSELTLAMSNKYIQDINFNPNDFNAIPWNGGVAVNGTVKQYIPSITKDDGKNYAIVQGKLEYVDLIVKDGLILWLDGADFKNSPQTTTWIDKSGNGNNATCYSFAYSTSSGSDGNGVVAFDGTDDYALVNYNFPSTLTIEAWGKANIIDLRMLWSFDGNSYTYGPDLFPASNKLYLNIGDGTANPFSNQTSYPLLNIMHQYVVVFNQSTNLGILYIDGSLVGTATYRNPSGPKLYIGKFDNAGYYWNGTIKSVKVYNRVLSAAEILQSYNEGK